MESKYWLVVGIAAVGGIQIAACSSNFDSCADSRTCPSHASQGEAGASSGEGGAAGGDDGESGAGGTVAAAPEKPKLFGPCAGVGGLACDGAASARRLACDGKIWQAGTTCADGERCDSTNGECTRIVAECSTALPGQNVCRGDKLLTCGPDLVTAVEAAACVGLCKDGICQMPACGDLKVEPGEECDEGNVDQSGACSASCKKKVCGDGQIFSGHEQCDDHNTVSGDGCSATCNWEPIALALGDSSSCALSANGKVKCWGYNGSGSLGIGDDMNRGDKPNQMGPKLLPVSLGANQMVKSIAAGGKSVCALLEEGGLKCWGDNFFGQLGTGDRAERGSKPELMGDALKAIPFGAGEQAISVSTGRQHTCAVLNTGAARCWGSGWAGELGLGDTADYPVPTQSRFAVLGNSISKAIDATGNFFTCNLSDDATERCWGSNVAGQLSINGLTNLGEQPGSAGDVHALSFGGGRTVKAIADGADFACALLSDSSVKCWGDNLSGMLGTGDAERHGTTPAALAALPSIDLGPGRSAKSISAGAYYACAVLDNGDLKCWGDNGAGGLGQGDTVSRGNMPGQMGGALKPVSLGSGRTVLQVAVGGGHTCALLDNGTVKCWGWNNSGQLGLGDTANRGSSIGEMGDSLPAVDLSF